MSNTKNEKKSKNFLIAKSRSSAPGKKLLEQRRRKEGGREEDDDFFLSSFTCCFMCVAASYLRPKRLACLTGFWVLTPFPFGYSPVILGWVFFFRPWQQTDCPTDLSRTDK